MHKPKCFWATLCLILSLQVHAISTLDQSEAFGRPGIQANWASAKNVQVGTFYEKGKAKSPVWFTNAEGMLTESFYPTIDIGQIKDSQFLISDNKTFVAEEKHLKHTTRVITPAMVELINTDKQGRFNITHKFFTMQDSPTIVDEVEIVTHVDGLNFYLLTNPHINNTGSSDTARVVDDGMYAHENNTALGVRVSTGFRKMSVGFVGKSDGWQDLNDNFQMDYSFTSASGGNVALTGEVDIPARKGVYKFYVVYTFSDSRLDHLTILPNYEEQKKAYLMNWGNYFARSNTPKGLSSKELALYYRSLYVLKTHEDKYNPGAMIASLSIPWGEKQYERPGQKIGGYHLIWPRDLYHVAVALVSAGDLDSPMNALRFLKKIQYKKDSGSWELNPRNIRKEGAFPQNTWVSGEEYWGGLQLDQVGYPIHLFYQIYTRVDVATKTKMLREFKDMLTKALDFIVTYGPWTQQERWEENFGISPSSFSVATSALIIGSRIFNNEYGRKLFSTAQGWLTKPNDNIDTWTYTTNGQYGDGRYYLRIAGGSSFGAVWDPNDRSDTHIANSSRRVEQSLILDQGFLKLALMGLRPANDEKLIKSKALVDQHISKVTPNGRGWYRYSFDAYGEESKGRLWPLLSSEHGRFAIERYRVNDLTWPQAEQKIAPIVESYLGFANDGLMIPEQVWEQTGEGTGAATPLAWSHAEYIKLLWSRNNRHNVENILSRR